MRAPLTHDEAMSVLYAHGDRAWIDEFRSTPDGLALLDGLIDQAIAADARDAQRWSSMYVGPHSTEIGPPASGATYATTTLGITLRKAAPITLTMPAGTAVQTPDGHIYQTDAPLSFTPADVGVPKTVPATAKVPGFPGWIPAGEINAFTKIANGITGAGLQIALVSTTLSTEPKALRFFTDYTKPRPFKEAMLGLYLTILDADPAGAANVRKLVRITSVTAGSTFLLVPEPETAYAWSDPADTTTDVTLLSWTTGGFAYTWTLLDWDDLGFAVTNATDVVGGVDGVLDELAAQRGRPRLLGEGDESVRARLLRAPNRPSPIGMLRKVILALRPFGYGRADVQIYEIGERGPDAGDKYGPNFPAAMGFIADLHATDMGSPITLDAYCKWSPTKASIIPPVPNPGLDLVARNSALRTSVVRCDPTLLIPAAEGAIFLAADNAGAPPDLVQLYNPAQWGF